MQDMQTGCSKMKEKAVLKRCVKNENDVVEKKLVEVWLTHLKSVHYYADSEETVLSGWIF